MEYYRIFDDIRYPGRWYLGDVMVPDIWAFTRGVPLDEKEFRDLEIEIDQDGQPMDLTLTDGRLVPVVSKSFAECLYEFMGDVQLLPVKIPKRVDKYYVMVIKDQIDCVDESLSDFDKFEPGNDIRPDLAGEYQAIRVLKVDKARINKHIFRIAKYHVMAIVSGELKDKLEKAHLRGLKFKLVS